MMLVLLVFPSSFPPMLIHSLSLKLKAALAERPILLIDEEHRRVYSVCYVYYSNFISFHSTTHIV